MTPLSMRDVPRPDPETLALLCLRHHIRSLKLSGSALRDDFRPDSDIDLLVEFEPNHLPGFLRLHEIAEDLSTLIDAGATR